MKTFIRKTLYGATLNRAKATLNRAKATQSSESGSESSESGSKSRESKANKDLKEELQALDEEYRLNALLENQDLKMTPQERLEKLNRLRQLRVEQLGEVPITFRLPSELEQRKKKN